MTQTKAQLIDGKSASVEFSSGAAGTPSITFSGDTNTGLFNPVADTLAISTNGVQRLTVNSSGNVGIATSTPDEKLAVNGAIRVTSNAIQFNASDGGVFDYNAGNIRICAARSGATDGAIQFFTTASGSITEKARLTASGQWLVGTSSVVSSAGHTPRFMVSGTDFNTSTALVLSTANDSTGGYLHLAKARGANAVQNGDTLGQIHFTGLNTSGALLNAAWISAQQDGGTVGTTSMPGRLVFSTTADGASSPTERMRIKSDGFVVITANNTSALTTSYAFTASGVGLYRPGSNTEIGWFGGASPALKFNAWWDGGVDRLQITDADYTHGVVLAQNSNAWGSYSDARLKQDVVPLTDAIQILQSVNPCRFKWKSGLQHDLGFIAQELKPILPEAVDGEESDFRKDKDGRVYGPMTVKYEKLIPVLTAALQESIGRIESLEAEVAALKAQ